MRVLDLFSGIGGFSLGLERAGMETVAFCEIEEFPRKVLRKHWPDVPIYEDVKELTGERLRADGIECDLICGGFPCQDISVAGKGAGLEGERSGLWSEFARLIGELRPRYVIVENVAALLGRGLGTVLGDLAALGYDAEWHCIPASYVGAPHRRDRIWIVAYATCAERNGKRSQPTREQSGFTNSREDVADTERQRLPGQGESFPAKHTEAHSLREAIEIEHGRVGDIWRTEPAVGRVANGIPAELDLYRGLIGEEGNGQEADAEIMRKFRWRLLRTMWEQKDTAKTSPELYAERLRDCLPEVPCGDSHAGWYLGAWIEESEGLCDLWQAFYSKSFEEAQDLQQSLLERIRKIERTKEVGPTKGRVDRLKGLGNAVVPQIPELIGRAIMEAQ